MTPPALRATLIALLVLSPALPSAAAAAPGDSPPVVALDEARAVELALQNTLAMKLSVLRRENERFSYRVARLQFSPTVALASSAARQQSRAQADPRHPLEQRETESFDVSPTVTWQVPTGGSFNYSWGNRFSASSGARDHVPSAPVPAWNLGWTLSFSQPLLRGGGLTAGTASFRQAKIAEQLSQIGFRSAVIGSINEVLSALRALVQAQEAEAIAARSLERGRQLMEINGDLLKTGRASRSEVTQSQADLASRELSLMTARNGADGARLRLSRLLALPPETRFEVMLPKDLQRVTSTPARALEVALRERADWRTSLLANEAADLGLAVARNGFLWDLRLSASTGRTGMNGSTSSYRDAFGGLTRPDAQENSVGLTLTVPVWDNLQRRQALAAAKNSRRERELTHGQLRQNIESEVVDQLRNLDVAWKSLEIARTARGFATTALEDESVRLRAGLTTTMNITRLEDALVAAQNAELGAAIGYLNAVTAFDTTLGATLDTWRVRIDAERGAVSAPVP